MADSTIGLPADGPGKKVDTESLTVAATTVQRERMQLAGALANDIVIVTDTDAGASDHGLVIRPTTAVSSQTSTAVVVTVSPGSTGSVDSTQLTSATTGKLLRFEASGSVPFKVELQTVVDAVATTRIVRFGRGRDIVWEAPTWNKDAITQAHSAGAGFDGFRLLFTNMDTGTVSSDFYGTFFWDEVV